VERCQSILPPGGPAVKVGPVPSSGLNQRWAERRHSFRPDEAIRTALYEVAAIEGDTTARDFIEAHHYSGTYPAARRRFGLYRGARLEGVAVFSVPCNPRALTRWFPGVAEDLALELGRFVLLDSVPGNGESWMLARCFEILKAEGFLGVVSFSDPVPRTALDGRPVFAGHVGRIYQATNAIKAGRSKARTLRLLPDGRVLSDRAISKLRAGERGWEYAARQLAAFGADVPAPGGQAAWLAHWLPRLTRAFRHPGNHRYLFPLDRRVRRTLPASEPYPKSVDAA
jgi:hypothetical protein